MQRETGEPVAIAVSAALAEAIAAGPTGELTFIASEQGRPMTKESFGNLLRDAVKAAVVTKSAHGLRKVAATAGFPRRGTDASLVAGEAYARRTASPAPCGKPSRTPWNNGSKSRWWGR